MIEAFKKLDFYKRLPPNISKSTFSGFLNSVVCLVLMALLFLYEYSKYIQISIQSDILVDDEKKDDLTMNIYFDITFYEAPCELINPDFQDIIGNHQPNVDKGVEKIPLNKVVLDANDNSEQAIYKKVKGKEGCRMKGSVVVGKVPGNVHFSSHTAGNLLSYIAYMEHMQIFFLNMSHKIDYFTFDKKYDVTQEGEYFSSQPSRSLESISGVDTNSRITYNYYVNLVPTKYVDLHKNEIRSNLFTLSKSSNLAEGQSAVYFRYEISPMYVLHEMKKMTLWLFIVRICAVIGGVFTVSGLLHGMFSELCSMGKKDTEYEKVVQMTSQTSK